MSDSDDARVIGMLRRVMRDCDKLYRHCGTWMVRRHPTLLQGRADRFVELMDDLHRGLLVKVYVTAVRADDRWTSQEKRVAAALIEHLWSQQLRGTSLREAATELFRHADSLSWESLVAPFVRYAPLADSRAQVETIVMRLANLVAKCDGQTMPEEAVMLHTLQRQIDMALNPADPSSVLADLEQPTGESAATGSTAVATRQQRQTSGTGHSGEPPAPMSEAERAQRLAHAMAELDGLIGLEAVKERVRSYTNFLKLQLERRNAGLVTMPINLHMTFTGNPGTGKTTVARIVGQILGALGTLEAGHVVETDRSGLVAQYAGQTAPKTNQLCDSARGGILFIDEAYSLVSHSTDDAYGREAIQTLLKRMEDDRESMAVILAGYTNEMESMVRSNPGLSSRINTKIVFDDYDPPSLGRIFEQLCNQNQYKLPSDARHRVLLGFDTLYRKRDRHFGNGRLARNAFEDTVRRLADRIAEVADLTDSLLTTLTAADISVPGLSANDLDQLVAAPHRLGVKCSHCQHEVVIKPKALGDRVTCNKCDRVELADWASIHRG